MLNLLKSDKKFRAIAMFFVMAIVLTSWAGLTLIRIAQKEVIIFGLSLIVVVILGYEIKKMLAPSTISRSGSPSKQRNLH